MSCPLPSRLEQQADRAEKRKDAALDRLIRRVTWFTVSWRNSSRAPLVSFATRLVWSE